MESFDWEIHTDRETYRLEMDGIVASAGGRALGAIDGWWKVRDTHDPDGTTLSGTACDTATAKFHAELDILELRQIRDEPSTTD